MSQNPIVSPSPYVVGPPVLEEGCFFGRDDAIRSLVALLSGPQLRPVRVLGIRRSGKTSFLRRLSTLHSADQMIGGNGDPVLLVYVELIAVNNPAAFYLIVAEQVFQAADGKAPPLPNGPLHYEGEFHRWLMKVCAKYRLVILLDEFEQLAVSDGFGLEFFRFLRTLISHRLVWVTASFRDLPALSVIPGREGYVSPLYNQFHPTPIYLGPMKPTEAEAIIREPARSYQIEFSSDEVSNIRSIAGDLPYFLQAVAETWFFEIQNGIPKASRLDRVLERHSGHDSLTWKQCGNYWRDLSRKEQHLLRQLANSRTSVNEISDRSSLWWLRSYGLVQQDSEGQYRPAGRLFRDWINRESDHAQGNPRVFIGYGHGDSWLRVKVYLEHDLYMETVSFSSESRVGESIVPILEEMKARADFAVIVLTKDDEMKNENWRARQNVVHEAGFFQASLGFDHVAVLCEEGVEMLSNLDGLQVIPFQGANLNGALFQLTQMLKRENLCP